MTTPTPEERAEPGGRLFWATAGVGWVVIVGATVWLRGQRLAHVPDLARFLVGTLLGHDAVLAPLVVAFGLLVVRIVPPSVRGVVQGGVLVSASVVLFAFPFVRGYGRHPDNPSALPGNYATGLLTVLGVVWGITLALGLIHRRQLRARR